MALEKHILGMAKAAKAAAFRLALTGTPEKNAALEKMADAFLNYVQQGRSLPSPDFAEAAAIIAEVKRATDVSNDAVYALADACGLS